MVAQETTIFLFGLVNLGEITVRITILLNVSVLMNANPRYVHLSHIWC